jgi:hypothetical protein
MDVDAVVELVKKRLPEIVDAVIRLGHSSSSRDVVAMAKELLEVATLLEQYAMIEERRAQKETGGLRSSGLSSDDLRILSRQALAKSVALLGAFKVEMVPIPTGPAEVQ